MDLKRPTSTLFLACLSLTLSLSPLPSVVSHEAPAYQNQLLQWSQLMHHARTLDKNDPGQFSSFAELWPLMNMRSSEWRDALLKATSSVMDGDVSGVQDDVAEWAMTLQQNVSALLCLNHTFAVLEGLRAKEGWALQMLDAMGKPNHGITEGNVLWPGGYNQCLNVTANTSVVSHPYFSGRYCTILSKPPPTVPTLEPSVTLSLGVCVPDTCTSADITLILHTVLKLLNVTSPAINPVAVCVEEDRPINAKAVVAIVICSIIGLLMVVGTLVDILVLQLPKWTAQKMVLDEDEEVNEATAGNANGPSSRNSECQPLLTRVRAKTQTPEFGVLGKVLVSFSVYTNGSKLLSTSQPPGSLTCVHGVRFLSMSWVVLGHTWGTPAAIGMNIMPYLKKLNSHWSYQGITNATVSVDSFFVLSGLLVAYLTLKELKKRGGKLNWFLFYFHRFWRLTPAYMLCLMVYICLSPYWGEGPFWPAKLQDEDFCADNWWTNLLYINNIVRSKEACFGQSWYLANDMQFYILSPLIFMPLFFFPTVGFVVAGVFLLATSIIPGVLSQHYGLPPGLLQQVEGPVNGTAIKMWDYMDIYYFKPYNRMGPYVVGMLAGYFLYRKDCKLRIHWVVNLAIWAVAKASALAVLYGLFESSNGHPVTVPVAAFYNAVGRQVWGACVAWVVVACVTGNGGFVNTILSWRALIPLSRLTYCIYLLHIMVLQLYAMNQYSLFYLNDLNLTFMFLGALVASSMVAFVASLAFEAPMMGLEKALLHPSPSKSSEKR